MKQQIWTKKPDYRFNNYFEVRKSGVVLRVSVYLPETGTGSLNGRLLRLMENKLREQGKG